MASELSQVDAAAVRAAADRIAPFVHRTPVHTSRRWDDHLGARLFFKCENFQVGGAFKARGAFNAVWSLGEQEAARGVATHSSGNHGAALALAAARRGIPAWVVVPRDASGFKRRAIERYGARVVACEPGISNREARLAALVEDCGATVVHPYDDDRVIAGQGTTALELLAQAPGIDLLLAPVGGGGLIAGCAVMARDLRPDIAVVAAEPAGADDCWQSMQRGERVRLEQVDTVADGLRASIGSRNWSLISRLVDEVVRVEEEEIIAATRLAWEVLKVVIEPSSAVPLAALLSGRLPVRGRRVGVVLSGGNVEVEGLAGRLSTCGLEFRL
ncbi:pyridoxal-phosphate dependent enzyme [Thioalkalivibrio sp. XN8]|uniref:pyridoxal-phosphate dependent enzyme n=1 Tax=Thioalkalivibrio sp. XN8 TaxID=2712863 RepID=UPI0013ECBFB6|nr:pyridoxal-phosphate dependent enzyme [Thioalkalivibrio sp. XN8]NGP54353.1 pyridoxal-phosphate dependent enzyme [Thioalkalivibrio sp. XN8]